MENERLKMLCSFVSKHFTGSPSSFAHWLNREVISGEEKLVEFPFLVINDMTNPVGMLHVGVISGKIDDCVGVNFSILTLGYCYPTVNFHI